MIEKVLDIKVVSRVGVISQHHEVGSYKMGLRTVFKEPKHLVVYKWMVLTDPKNLAEVKVCIKGSEVTVSIKGSEVKIRNEGSEVWMV